MSCIAGQWCFGEARADAALVERMLRAMRARAPHGDASHAAPQVALGQAFLRTGRSGAEQPQRLTLDGNVWIVADARIDARADLLRELRASGRQVSGDAPHAELILHAYHAFGDGFLDHLLGDFAFALWDASRQRMICARDHFGVRPFYYAQVDGMLLFASDIGGVVASGRVPQALDDLAIADFLLFGMCTEAHQTIYRQVRCLPPAHRMDVTDSGMTLNRYWAPPRKTQTWLASRQEYVEAFSTVFEQAVRDRLPDAPVALQLSGGMDSTSIAAAAQGHPATAFHLSCKRVIPDDVEGELASEVAQQLGLPFVSMDISDQPLFAPSSPTAMPFVYPHLAVHESMLSTALSGGAHVMLSGYSGDAALSGSASYYPSLLRQGHWLRFAREALHYRQAHGSLKATGLRSLWPRVTALPSWKPAVPDWIQLPGISPQALAARWDAWWEQHHHAMDAERQFRLPWIQRQFEANEALALPVVFRYPFHDLRLLKLLASLPNFVLLEKSILRDAMRGRLPASVRTRPKTGLSGDPVRALVTNGKLEPEDLLGSLHLPQSILAHNFRKAWKMYCQGSGADSTWTSWLMLQPIALGNWLSQQQEQ